jgi:thiol peroxidase
MATITLGGNTVHTSGTLPEIGSQTPDFKLTAVD